LAQELAEFIGPLASVLVKKAASRAQDNETLYRMLAEALPEGEPRQRFLAARSITGGVADVRAPVAAPAAQPAGRGWDEAELKEAEQRLAVFLGPVAKVLVRRTAKETTDRPQFYRRLADELGSDKDRETFLGGFTNR
jgi:serine/threonine-protein kinase